MWTSSPSGLPPFPARSTTGGGAAGAEECRVFTAVDPALAIAEDKMDVIVGEVKQGEAVFNPGLNDPHVLHAALRRIGDVFGAPIDQVVDALTSTGRLLTRRAQVRLVAFGSHGTGASVLTHRHLVGFLREQLRERSGLSRATRFSDPVLGLLELMDKAGA